MAISFVALAYSTDEVDPELLNVGPKPTGTAENNVMLAHVWAYEEEVTDAPDDWTLVEGPLQTNDVEGQPEVYNAYLYIKEATDSEPDDYTWETTTDTGPAPNRRVVIASYRGVFTTPDVSEGFSEDRSTHTENASSNTLPIHAMDTGNVGRRLVLMAAAGIPGITGSMPSPWVERLDHEGLFLFDRRIVVAGSVTVSTLTLSMAVTSWGFEIMLVPEPDTPGDRNYCASIDTQIN